MKTVSLELSTTINLGEFEPDQQVESIIPVTVDILGAELNQMILTAVPTKSTFWSASWNLGEDQLEAWSQAHVGLYAVQNGSLQRISPHMMRLQFGTDSLTCEFLSDQNVTAILLVAQLDQPSGSKFELVGSEYVHQLLVESATELAGFCSASGKSVSLTNGVNLVKQYGRLSVEFYGEITDPVQLVPIRVSDQVVFKNIAQPAGMLASVSESFTQKRGNESVTVNKDSPSLNTLQFYEFDAVCDQTKPQPSLTFAIPTPTSCLVVYRNLNDVLVTFQIKPSGSGILPVLSDQILNLEG